MEKPGGNRLRQAAAQYLIFALIAWLIWSKLLKPVFEMFAAAAQRAEAERKALAATAGQATYSGQQLDRGFEDKLKSARNAAYQEPKLIAELIKEWRWVPGPEEGLEKGAMLLLSLADAARKCSSTLVREAAEARPRHGRHQVGTPRQGGQLIDEVSAHTAKGSPLSADDGMIRAMLTKGLRASARQPTPDRPHPAGR